MSGPHILIAGAGIGGIVAALALVQKGFEVSLSMMVPYEGARGRTTRRAWAQCISTLMRCGLGDDDIHRDVDHISGEDRGETAFDGLFHPPSSRADHGTIAA
jgi:glycine/D-amino acid oxidase-like deaminating enzyme